MFTRVACRVPMVAPLGLVRRRVVWGGGGGRRCLTDGRPPPQQAAAAAAASATATATATAAPGRSAVQSGGECSAQDVLREVRQLLGGSPVPIGSLFQALSPRSKTFLVKSKTPLETFLRLHPREVCLYSRRRKQSIIYCCLPHQVPPECHDAIAAFRALDDNGLPRLATPGGGGRSADGACRVHAHMTRQEKVLAVLAYIPNDWAQFTDLAIPEEVRVFCMGKPGKRASEFFQEHPQWFEMRAQPRAGHTFLVRRAMALQLKEKSRR